MKHARFSSRRRKPVNLSLQSDTISEAKELGINLSEVCDRALKAAIKKEREDAWIKENWEAIQSSNAWVEQHGLPLEKYRMF